MSCAVTETRMIDAILKHKDWIMRETLCLELIVMVGDEVAAVFTRDES